MPTPPPDDPSGEEQAPARIRLCGRGYDDVAGEQAAADDEAARARELLAHWSGQAPRAVAGVVVSRDGRVLVIGSAMAVGDAALLLAEGYFRAERMARGGLLTELGVADDDEELPGEAEIDSE